MRTTWNPLRPLAAVTRLVTWVAGLGALAIVIANVAGLGWLPGTGVEPACVDTTGGAAPLKPGAVVTGGLVCVDHPDPAQRVAGLGNQVPQILFGLGALLLLLWFPRTAAQQGPYVAGAPGRLSALGWFVLVGGPASALLLAVSRYFLRTALITGVPSSDWLTEWRTALPWWSIAAGIAALTFAYILRIGVRMHEDLEGIV